MPDLNDFHAFKSTQGEDASGSGAGGGNGSGCGWVVAVVVVVVLVFFIASGSSWDAIDRLLGLGLIAFFVAKALFR